MDRIFRYLNVCSGCYMSKKLFDKIDKVLGPPPKPLVFSKKKGWLHKWFPSKSSTLVMTSPPQASIILRKGKPGALSTTEKEELKQFRSQQCSFKKRESWIEKKEKELSSKEKEIKERFDLGYNLIESSKKLEKLTNQLKSLEESFLIKEKLVSELDSYMLEQRKHKKKFEKELSQKKKDLDAYKNSLEKDAEKLSRQEEKFTHQKESPHTTSEKHEKHVSSSASEKQSDSFFSFFDRKRTKK